MHDDAMLMMMTTVTVVAFVIIIVIVYFFCDIAQCGMLEKIQGCCLHMECTVCSNSAAFNTEAVGHDFNSGSIVMVDADLKGYRGMQN